MYQKLTQLWETPRRKGVLADRGHLSTAMSKMSGIGRLWLW